MNEPSPAPEPIFLRQFKSEQENVSNILSELDLWMSGDARLKSHCEDVAIVLAETLNNVVEHAYKGSAKGDISLFVGVDTDQLCCEVRDFGEKFPGIPHPQEMSGPEQNFEDLPEGGFGWFLIQSLTTKIESVSDDDSNCIRLIFDCSPKDS
ncbi:ATP-binding protein [Paramylibacter kogurei]|nr:ATP-binding protein [Amylibacter kogurei]